MDEFDKTTVESKLVLSRVLVKLTPKVSTPVVLVPEVSASEVLASEL